MANLIIFILKMAKKKSSEIITFSCFLSFSGKIRQAAKIRPKIWTPIRKNKNIENCLDNCQSLFFNVLGCNVSFFFFQFCNLAQVAIICKNI
jgi:hypothetical protein